MSPSATRSFGRCNAGWAHIGRRKLAAAWGAAYTLLSEFMIGEAYGRSAAAE